jgi:hypothetical protein
VDLLKLGVVLIVGSSLGGCFAPNLDGAYRCGPDDACPKGLFCAADKVCRRAPGDGGALDRDGAVAADQDGAVSDQDGAMPDLAKSHGGHADMAHAPQDLAMRSADAATECVPHTCGGSIQCGKALDGCGGMISCGNCMGMMMMCGGGGPNLCGVNKCMPQTCKSLGATCGLVSDGCAAVLSCGNCPGGQTCDAQNHCG